MWKLSRDLVVFVEEVKVKFLLCKRLKVMILLKEENGNMDIVQLWQIKFVVTYKVRVICWNYIIYAPILNANVRNKLLLLQNNFKWKELGLKILWKKSIQRKSESLEVFSQTNNKDSSTCYWNGCWSKKAKAPKLLKVLQINWRVYLVVKLYH